MPDQSKGIEIYGILDEKLKKIPVSGIFLRNTPRAGFEPATNRLTVDRSTAELPRIKQKEHTLNCYLRASVLNRL